MHYQRIILLLHTYTIHYMLQFQVSTQVKSVQEFPNSVEFFLRILGGRNSFLLPENAENGKFPPLLTAAG